MEMVLSANPSGFGVFLKKMNVLVINQSMYPTEYYSHLPYIYGVLRRFQELSFKDLGVRWLKPLYQNDIANDSRLTDSFCRDVDVLAASCYEWNFNAHIDLALKFKKINPSVKTVFGGPHIVKGVRFLKKHPVIDYGIAGEGERVFCEFLNYISGNQSFPEGISSRGQSQFSSKIKKRVDLSFFDKGVFELYFDDYLEMIKKDFKDGELKRLWVTLETNRGCPYRCSFCDWGSLTNSRVSLFPLKSVFGDIRALAELKVKRFYITDANFGMMERDEHITEYLCEIKEKYGYPEEVYFSMAKTHGPRVARIYKMLLKSNLIGNTVQIPIQTYSESSLKDIQRKNMSEKDLLSVKKVFQDQGVPIGTVLIAGCPGETLKSWRETVRKSLLNGYEIRIFDWFVLPNAPVNQPDYIKRYRLKFLRRPLLRIGQKDSEVFHPDALYLVSSYSYTMDDWIEMKVIGSVIQALFTIGVGREIYDFLQSLSITQEQVYNKMLDIFYVSYPKIVDDLRLHYREFLSESRYVNILFFKKYIEPEEFVTYSLLVQLDQLKGYYFKIFEAFGLKADETLIQKWISVFKTPDQEDPNGFFKELGIPNRRQDSLFKPDKDIFNLTDRI